MACIVADGIAPDATWVNSWGVVYGGVPVALLLDAWAGSGLEVGSVHLAFERPVREGAVEVVVDGSAGAVSQAGEVCVRGFAVAARRSGASTPPAGLGGLPRPGDLPEAVGRGTADFIAHHVDLRLVAKPAPGDAVVRQWARLRHAAVDADGHLPVAALGLLADLASVGVYRSALAIERRPVVQSLDLALHLTGRRPTTWTLLTLDVPPIVDGGAVARAAFHDEHGHLLGAASQSVRVRPARSP